MTEFQSLSTVIDVVNESSFYQKLPSPEIGSQLSAWIAGRAGKGHAYGPLPGLTEDDRIKGVRLFTGEKVAYSARARHVMGEEALRALIILGRNGEEVAEVIRTSEDWITTRLKEGSHPGMF